MATKTEDIVISGISGRFPECNSMEEFKQKLLDGVDLVTEDDRRWPPGTYNIPTRSGKIPHLEHFDANFFGIPPKQAHKMDPQIRLLIECTFETLLDAGINPVEVRGSKIGVYVGVCESESHEYWRQDIDRCDEYGLSGACRQMFSNRVSFAFDFKGPNYVVDSGCASTHSCLHMAVQDIINGECKAAIVGGSSICLMPEMTYQFFRMKVLSPDGKCKVFDASANGYVRSEGVVTLFLQKASAARRVYTTVVGSKVNCDGYNPVSIGFPSAAMQEKLAKELYEEIGVKPEDVGYVEAHGTGTKVGDEQETKAIVRFFCKNRSTPLLIGSVKSNMGHPEAVSSMCSIAKVLIAMETGTIPANLHYKNPSPTIPALADGRLKVVSTNTTLASDLVAINSSGVGGVNCHVLLRRNQKLKASTTAANIPRLVIASGRTESAVAKLLTEAEKHQDDVEFLALLDKVHAFNIPRHEYRGFKILGSKVQEIARNENVTKPPIWFVFSGMGSQWSGMAKQLMQIEAFSVSIRKNAKTLEPFGVDLKYLLVSADEEALKNILNLLVCITAVQIALVDVLRTMGVQPDGIIGYSVGETACAYADGCLTAEQTILAAYYRGQAFLQTKLVSGAMAVVNLTWEECKKRCPPNVFPACHISQSRVTISGRTEDINKFVKELNSKNIFATIVKGDSQAFHCKYTAGAAPILDATLSEVIVSSKERSSKWISSSVAEGEWNTPEARICSATYLANNIKNPVLFYEALQHVPKNAIVLELSPHGFLQHSITETLGQNGTYLSLIKRDYFDNVEFFLLNLGKLFLCGGQPDVSKIYPPVVFPVGRGTPMISSLVEWDHSEKWTVPRFSKQDKKTGQIAIIIDTSKKDKYLTGHVINDHLMLPATAYLTVIWQAFAKQQKVNFEQMPVVMENVQFYRPTIMSKDAILTFTLTISEKVYNNFEMYENGTIVASGTIFPLKHSIQEFSEISKPPSSDEEVLVLSSEEIYKILDLRGYHYEGVFRGIVYSDESGREGKVEWNKNWVAFMDTLLQFSLIGINARSMFLPTGFQRVVIDPVLHSQLNSKELPVNTYHNMTGVRSGGIDISGIRLHLLRQTPPNNQLPKLETSRFVALEGEMALTAEILLFFLHIVWENTRSTATLKILETRGTSLQEVNIKEVLTSQASIAVEYSKFDSPRFIEKSANLVIELGEGQLENAANLLVPGAFLICKEEGLVCPSTLDIISVQTCSVTSKKYTLLRKKDVTFPEYLVIRVRDDNFSWVDQLKLAMKRNNVKIFLVEQTDRPSGIVGIVDSLLQEPGGCNIRSYYVQNKSFAKFNISSDFYGAQIQKDLVYNVLDTYGKWGTYCNFTWKPESVETKEAFVENAIPGDLDSLEWVQSPLKYYTTGDINKKCTVHFSGLNARDELYTSGKLLPKNFFGKLSEEKFVMGCEFSGQDETGKSVMGIVPHHSLATSCIIQADWLIDVPEHWSLKEAATVPYAYATSYYALVIRGQIQKTESILIHISSGAVELAAVSITLSMGCKVFVSFDNDTHISFFLQTFPNFDRAHIGVLGDKQYKEFVKKETNWNGVDLVLDTLPEDRLASLLLFLAENGRFLNLGAISTVILGISELANRSILNIDFHSYLCTDSLMVNQVFDLLRSGINTGAVKPLPYHTFTKTTLKEAFKSNLNSLKKTLVEVYDKNSMIMVKPKSYFDPSKKYIIIDGWGGFGLELINWLISRGATKITWVSQTLHENIYKVFCLNRWKERGINVSTNTLNPAIFEEAQLLVQRTSKDNLLGGIFILTQTSNASTFEDQVIQKINTAHHLDILSHQLDTQLDHFVVFSSNACNGEAAKGFANSWVDRLCETRRANGFPGLAIQWGATNFDETNFRGAKNIEQVRFCLNILDTFLQQPRPVVLTKIFKQGNSSSTSHSNVIDEIAHVLGVDNTKQLRLHLTLNEYGIDSHMAVTIMQVLEKKYDLIVSLAKIRSLTLADLIHLTTGGSTNDKLFVHVQFECIPTSVLVEMSPGVGPRPVFFVHPIEGHVRMLQSLAKLIGGPIYGLQHTKECPTASLTTFAQHYIKQIKKVQPLGPYLILGYSLGAAIAFEMGLQLQTLQETATLIMVDGSHSTVQDIFKSYDQDLISLIASHFASLSRDLQRPSVINILRALKTTREQIAGFSKILAKNVSHSLEEIEVATAALFYRLETGLSYKPCKIFDGDVILLRTKNDYVSAQEDYGLASVCSKKVKVYGLDGNHETILTGDSAAKIASVVQEVLNKI